VLLIAYMCPYSLEFNISSSFLLHFGQADNKNVKISRGQLAPCQENQNQVATNSEFRRMQGSGTECVLSIGFDAFLLSF